MTPTIPIPRKRRARQHVIADLSVNYVERFILDAGHTTQSMAKDYGYDLLLFTYDEHGYLEPGLSFLQLKALESLEPMGDAYVFDLNIRDYNLWMLNRMPVILILYDAQRRRGYWLHIQGYFQSDSKRRPKSGAKTIRVRIPTGQSVNRSAIAQIRVLKQAAVEHGRKE